MTLRRTLTFAALGFAVAGAAQAQTAADNRDADALAADMRILAANPLDIEALITAGELTLRMGDNTAAATFFGRAEKLDPNNPRIKAGWGSLMVRAERPGMALLRFQEAERRGMDPRKFAADRGLAYDLIGQQDRAQRDYRLALSMGSDDEVTRRYALSLGISGQTEEALRQLEPLLRRSDRAAWRDRAFILAMGGDSAGAERIAATMMSPGMGAGLTPFFRRLSQLSAADRAFAVNFGELRTTPERLADAQLVPPLPRLGPDPYAPKTVAALAPAVTMPAEDGRKRKKKRRKDDLAPAVPAATAPVEVALAPPAYSRPSLTPVPMPIPAPTSAPVPPPVRVAASSPRPVVVTTASPNPSPSMAAVPARPVVVVAPTPAPGPSASVAAALPRPIYVPPPPAPSPVLTLAPTPAPAPVIVAAPPPAPAPAPTQTPPIQVAAAPVTVPAEPTPGVADQPSAGEAGVATPTATARVSEDTVLARIVANLDQPSVPAPRPRRAPVVVAPAAKLDEAKPVETKTRGKLAKDEASDAKSGTAKGKDQLANAKTRGKTAAKDDEPTVDKNGCPLPVKTSGRGKTSAARSKTPMTARDKGNDARCKAATAKAKADAEAKGEPARVWVQVAGGANEGDLRKAWAGLQAKAPELFRGRQGWTTPLRATNRVLTGPFKSDDEAQAFVNRMAKAGLSGFVFTSPRGQKIERLGAK